MAAKIERRTGPIVGLEVRAAPAEGGSPEGGKQGVVIGHASVFDTPTILFQTDTYVVRETIRPGAFNRAIRDGQDVKALFNHNADLVLGRARSGTLKLSEDGSGLRYELQLPATQLGKDIQVLLDRGDVDQNSFAFLPRPGGRRETITNQNGVEYRDIEITDVDLYDISLVTYPAYPEAIVDELRGRDKASSPDEFESEIEFLFGFAQKALAEYA